MIWCRRFVCRWGSFLRPVDVAWMSRAQEYHQRFLTATTNATNADIIAKAAAAGAAGGTAGSEKDKDKDKDSQEGKQGAGAGQVSPLRSSRRNANKATTTTTTTSTSSSFSASEDAALGSAGEEDPFNADPAVVAAVQHTLSVARELRRITDPFLVFDPATGEEVSRWGLSTRSVHIFYQCILSTYPVNISYQHPPHGTPS